MYIEKCNNCTNGRTDSDGRTFIRWLTHVRKIISCLLNAFVNHFRNDTFEKKVIITATEVVLIHPFFLTDVIKIKNENTEYDGTFISFKNHFFSKEESAVLRQFGSWSAVFISIFGLSQSFSDNSNLITLVDI